MNNSKIVKGKFIVPGSDKSAFLKIKIAPSSIPQAGSGAFAEDFIPKGSRGIYTGVHRPAGSSKVDSLYSWEYHEYDKKTGKQVPDAKTLGYIDASNPKRSNWARYVNCGPTKKSNNFIPEQRFNKIYYVATRNIHPGEELFIDYGLGYRRDNLGMKGRY